MHALGIPLIDEKIDPAKSVLLRHEPGTETAAFLYHAIRDHAAAGKKVVYLGMDRPIERIKVGLMACGLDQAGLDRIHFIDGWKARVGMPSPSTRRLTDTHNTQGLVSFLGSLAKKHEGSLLIIESLSTILNDFGTRAIEAHRAELKAALGAFNRVLVVLTDWGYEVGLDWLSQDFPGTIELHGIQERVVTDYFFIARGPGGNVGPVPYRFVPKTGIVGYVPKIAVLGPHGSGKSTFLRTACDAMVGTDHASTTVAAETGRVEHKGLQIDLYGTPGHERFDPLLGVLANQAMGVLLVVDGSEPDSLPRAKTILQKIHNKNLPLVVAINRQEAPGGLDAATIIKRLGLPKDQIAVGYDAEHREQAIAVLDALLERLFNKEAVQ